MNAALKKSPNIVFIGDSITANWARVNKDFFNSNGIVARGIGGQPTTQILVRYRADALNLKPKTIVILAGINDLAHNGGVITEEHVLDNLISMVELAKYNKIRPVLCSVLPAKEFNFKKEMDAPGKIKKLNVLIRKYADENGVLYIDYYSALADENGGLPEKYCAKKAEGKIDPVHPNAEAYKIMESVAKKALGL